MPRGVGTPAPRRCGNRREEARRDGVHIRFYSCGAPGGPPSYRATVKGASLVGNSARWDGRLRAPLLRHNNALFLAAFGQWPRHPGAAPATVALPPPADSYRSLPGRRGHYCRIDSMPSQGAAVQGSLRTSPETGHRVPASGPGIVQGPQFGNIGRPPQRADNLAPVCESADRPNLL